MRLRLGLAGRRRLGQMPRFGYACGLVRRAASWVRDFTPSLA